MAQTHDPEDTRRAFDAAAADFVELGRYLWEPIGAATVSAVNPSPGDQVLDACCGAGASAIPAMHKVGPDGLVDAVDISGPLIAELARRTSELPRLRTHQADITTWTADEVEGGYDVVQSVLGIFFLPDMTADTKRLIEMSRPDGRVAFTIWQGGAMVTLGRTLGRAIALATDSEPPPVRPPHLIDRINRAEPFGDWLAEQGMSNVDVHVHELRLSTAPELAWLMILGSGYRGALTALAPDVTLSVRDHYLALLRSDGVDEIDATTLIGVGNAPHR